jgi:hypothetical protein
LQFAGFCRIDPVALALERIAGKSAAHSRPTAENSTSSSVTPPRAEVSEGKTVAPGTQRRAIWVNA